MNVFVTWNPPLPFDELGELSQLVKQSGAVVSPFVELREMDIETLVAERVNKPDLERAEIRAHLDSNFLAKLLELMRSRTSDPTDLHRHVAAIMALSITFGIEINPAMAEYEYACTGVDDPEERFVHFLYANELNPRHYADVALGRGQSLPTPSPGDLATHRRPWAHGFCQPLRGFEPHYAGVLAILAIHTSAEFPRKDIKSRKERMLRFLDWMHYDGIFSPCLKLAAYDLWGQRPGKTIIKNADSGDLTKLLESAKNAAWDLAIAYNWSEIATRDAGGNSPIELLYTLDRALQFVANQLLLRGVKDEADVNARVRLEAEQFWPASEAAEIMERYFHYHANRYAAERKCNGPDGVGSAAVESLTDTITTNLKPSS